MKSRVKAVQPSEGGRSTQDMHQRPLADRIRPQSIADFVGQQHLIGAGKPLYQVIQTNKVYSMILWGPPGVGKTTLARLIASHTGRKFFELSAVSAGKDEIRSVVQQTKLSSSEGRDMFSINAPIEIQPAPILFLDEIHRFNKAQQDFLLPFVEDGTVILIGATTENPSFEVISALLSRTRVFVLEALSDAEVRSILERGAQALGIRVDSEAAEFLVNYASGDARQSLNLLEVASELYVKPPHGVLELDHVRNAAQSKHLRYDKLGEEHYNTISAFIKSMRASKVDAALYYLARMVASGEDPLFIARRMVIFASEDVGIADPHALAIANAVFRACETIGYPEAQINLAHGAVYLAQAPKSRASCDSFFRALEDAQQYGSLPIPLELRNAPTKLMKELGYGRAAQAEDFDLLPEALHGKKYFSE